MLAATLVPFTGTARAATATRVFNYAVVTQTFTVPDGVTSITVTMTGGKLAAAAGVQRTTAVVRTVGRTGRRQ